MEIRVARGYRSVEDIDDTIAMMVDRVSKLPAAQRYVIAADFRQARRVSRCDGQLPPSFRVGKVDQLAERRSAGPENPGCFAGARVETGRGAWLTRSFE